MKKLQFALLFVAIIACRNSYAQSNTEAVIERQVQAFANAMVDANFEKLEKFTHDSLSYGHSSGSVENKKEFIGNILSGKSDFVSINLTHQTISIVGNTAIVRHRLDAVTNNDGNPGKVHLLILLVWQRQKGHWKLLARQAVKQP